MGAPVFISYSSKDQEAAETICAELEGRKLECWIAARDVPPGENFQEAIVRAIRAARVMVLVFTKNANNSDEIKNEVALASQHQLIVIPVRVEDVVPNDALAYALATRQWIDVFRDWKHAIDRLGSRIAAILSIDPTAVAPTPPERRPVQDAATTPHSFELKQDTVSATATTREGPAEKSSNRKDPTSSAHLPAGTAPDRRKRGLGLIGNILTGIVGAFLGVWLLQQPGISPFHGFIGSIVNATIGAVILLVIIGFIRR
jgi:uncharacterized membrane protein YeaQ/YmgE (transglycosylase-associated protein family)